MYHAAGHGLKLARIFVGFARELRAMNIEDENIHEIPVEDVVDLQK